jgi:Protein of unknown function (DUF3108)
MPVPRSRPLPAAVAKPPRRPGLRPAPALALAAVLGAHLWVIDAWSLPAVPPLASPATVRSVTTLATLPLPAPKAAESLAAVPALPLESPHAPALAPAPAPAQPPRHTPRKPAPVRPTAPVVAPSHSADAASTPVAVAATTATATAANANALHAPPSARLLYRLKKGPLTGTGQIDWQRDADTYRMRLEARVPLFGQIFLETSEGRLDASGLAPLRHTERRLKRSERAVSFVRDQGPPRILFSARTGEEPLTPGAQDRLSWIAQLAARMAAPPAGEWRAGHRIEMDVASTGGDVQRWVFTVQGQDSAGLWQLHREPDTPHDTRAEVWIDARQHHWPVRIQLTESSGEPLELTLDGLQPT